MSQIISNVRLTATVTLSPASPPFPGGALQADGATMDLAEAGIVAQAQARLDAQQGGAAVLQEFLNGAT